jgi:hypothetical protein
VSDFCRSCRAPVMWLDNVTTGKRAPIDRDPVIDGNIDVDEAAGTYRVLTGTERDAAVARRAPMHKNHFATCAQAPAWKARAAKAAGS